MHDAAPVEVCHGLQHLAEEDLPHVLLEAILLIVYISIDLYIYMLRFIIYILIYYVYYTI